METAEALTPGAALRGAAVRIEDAPHALRAELTGLLRARGAVIATDAARTADLVVRCAHAGPPPPRRPDDPALLVLAPPRDAAWRARALGLGADEVVCRPVDPEVLLARIGVVLRRLRRPESAPDGLEAGVLRLDPDTGRAVLRGREVHLTPRETALLAELMRAPGHVVPHTRVLRAVWGGDATDDRNLVATYVRYLRRKLDGPGPSIIRTVRGFGYALRI